MREIEIDRGGRVVRARDAGEPGGPAVMYFHGTPGSRLDLTFGEQIAAEHGVRLISFDRPGYGGPLPRRSGWPRSRPMRTRWPTGWAWPGHGTST